MRALRILFMLFVTSVLVSQSAMDFFSILLCGQWIWFVWKSKKSGRSLQLLRPMGLEWGWVVWFLVVVMGFVLNWRDTGYALERIVEFKWVFIFYVLFEVLSELRPDRESLRFLIPLGLFISLANLFLYFNRIPFLQPWQYRDDLMYRAGGFFANPMTFAHSFILFVCLLMGVTLLDFKNWQGRYRWGLGLVLGLSLWGLYLTFTRGVWIGFAVGTVWGIYLWRPRSILTSVLVGLVGISILYSQSKDFENRVDKTISELTGGSERKILWKAHFHIFQENPIFGAGYGQNTKQLPEVYEKMGAPKDTLVGHAHNEYLHLAAGTGLLGLICYLWVWFFFVRKNYDLWRHLATESWDKGVALGLMIGQIAFMVGSFTEANFEHSKVRFMVMLAWAYIIYLTEKYNSKTLKNEGLSS